MSHLPRQGRQSLREHHHEESECHHVPGDVGVHAARVPPGDIVGGGVDLPAQDGGHGQVGAALERVVGEAQSFAA